MGSAAPTVSVIVPMRNAASTVRDQVAALANQTPGTGFEVIWVDNGSTDGTLQLVFDATRDDVRMRVLSASEVQSSYFARNRGAGEARGTLLLFCDADDVVDRNWVAAMTSALADLDVVGGAVKHEPHEAAVLPTQPVAGFLPAATTDNLAIRRSVFEALEGFDALIPSGSDATLCWRAQLNGFRFGLSPDAVVLHRRRPTAWARIKRVWTMGRWYSTWVAPFVDLGADAPTIPATLRRIVDDALLPALRHPGRDYARGALWHLAVLSSCVWRPRRPSL